jgi:hypothetical protein
MYLFPVSIFRRKPRYRNLSHTHCYPTSSPRIKDENTLRVSLQSRIYQVEPERTKQMEPILRAKVKFFFESENLKKKLLIKNDGHIGFL